MSSAPQKVRLTVSVSKATDREVRALLGGHAKKGELSKFVEQAVQMQLFRVAVDDIKQRNAAIDAKKLQAEIDRAVREVRSERNMVPRRKKPSAAVA